MQGNLGMQSSPFAYRVKTTEQNRLPTSGGYSKGVFFVWLVCCWLCSDCPSLASCSSNFSLLFDRPYQFSLAVNGSRFGVSRKIHISWRDFSSSIDAIADISLFDLFLFVGRPLPSFGLWWCPVFFPFNRVVHDSLLLNKWDGPFPGGFALELAMAPQCWIYINRHLCI